MDAEERLARLEEENYFLSKRLADLDEALAGQQAQLDALQARLARAEGLLERLQEDAGAGALPANDPPPHFNTW